MTAYPRTQGQYAEYTTEQLEQVLVEAEIYRGIVDVYTALVGADKKAYPTLVFVPSVHMVNLTVKAFLDTYKKDIRVKWWTGDATDEGSISDDIQAYLRGEIDVLVACDMGGRGMNLPNARLLIDAYPTRSMTKI
jgi:superfamily II DNA/RNA helicase